MTRPRTWRGRDDFDNNTELFVFGYGSLVSPDSLAGTLGHEVDGSLFRDAHLAGWKRAWNVGSDKESHPERTFFLVDSDGGRIAEFAGVTAVLGIERTLSRDGCSGAVFPVERRDISFLDIRERNYKRTDVTDEVTWAGKPANCVVYTYAPRKEAVDRLAAAQDEGRPVNVRRAYVDLVELAFSSIGRLSDYRRGTPPIVYAVADMDVVIDPDLAPPVAQNAVAPYLASPGGGRTRDDVISVSDETALPDSDEISEDHSSSRDRL